MEKTRVGIVGYGNLGRGVELAAKQNDMQLVAIFTRRQELVKTCKVGLTGVAPMVHIDEIEKYKDQIDVLILCGGSATDLPEQTPKYAEKFNLVDSFDTHAKIPEHLANVDKASKAGGKVAMISGGWDPGIFSTMRLYGKAFLPNGNDYTFWGKGVSQGHSDAIRRIHGVKNARQYTIPVEEAVESVLRGDNPNLTTREKHTRECWVVAEEGADKAKIEQTIKEMPNYFADYDTTVNFISEEELKRDHAGLPHGGQVIRTGETGNGHKHVINYSLKLKSNPEFTGSVLVAYARAVHRMYKMGDVGAKTVFDVPPKFLLPEDYDILSIL